LSFGVAGFIQWSKTTEGLLTEQQFFYWMLLPTILLSTAEAIVFVSGGLLQRWIIDSCYYKIKLMMCKE
jgi:hypothetical protein